MDPLVWKGFKRLVEDNDLPPLELDMSAELVNEQFNNYWFGRDSTFGYLVYAYLGEASVLGPLAHTVIVTFLLGAFMKLFQDLAMFAMPQILSLLLALIQSPDPIWKGYLFAALLLAVATLQTIFSSQYYNFMYTAALKIRTVLLTAIYCKSLRLSQKSRKEFSTGEISSIVGVDTERVMQAVQYLNVVWSAPLEVILVFSSLWAMFGVSTLPGIFAMFLLVPLNWYLAKKIKEAQEIQMKQKDKRLQTVGEILTGIKVVKINAWEDCMFGWIDVFRNVESKALKTTAILTASSSVIWSCLPFVITLVIFSTFVMTGDGSNVLDAQLTFTALSLINILRTPLSNIPLFITSYVQAKVSLRRINKFMNAEEVRERAELPKKIEGVAVSVEESTFAWSGSVHPVLRDITIRAPRGSLVAITGNVASGKSALLLAILAELDQLSGSVYTKGKEAYVAQSPWLQNVSLRENILFGRPYMPGKYNEILEACALVQDLALLPDGDATLVGEMGSMLSGGQRARVALARAIYQDSDIFYLDNPLGSLDPKVSSHVFRSVIGPDGLLRKKTRLLVTGTMGYAAESDLVIVLKAGQVAEIGHFRDLSTVEGGELNLLISSGNLADAVEEFEDVEIDSDTEGTTDINRDRYYSISGDSFLSCEGASQWKDSLSKSRRSSEENNQIEEEKLEEGKITWALYLRYLRDIGVTAAASAVCWNFAYQATYVATGFWLVAWANDSTLRPPHPSSSAIGKYLGIYFLLGCILGGTTALADGTPMVACWRAGIAVHRRLLTCLLNAPMSFFEVTPVGRILARFATDVDVIDNTLPRAYAHALWCSLELLGIIVIISYTTPLFVVILIPIGLLYFFLQQFYIRTSRQLKRLESSSRAPILSHFSETLAGGVTIRAFDASAKFIRKFYKTVDKNNVHMYPNLIISRWLSVRLEMIGNFVIFFAALFALFERDSISSSLVGLSISFALQITQTLNGLVRGFIDVETYMISVERTEQYSKIPQERNDLGAPRPGWPEEGKMELREFTMAYRRGQTALDRLSASVRPGERVAVVGRTGAGKSSLAACIFRLIDSSQEQGSILIDDVNIANVCPRLLRARFAIIAQDPVLFSGTVKLNLDPWMKHTDEEIWSALEKVQLKKFVSKHSEGLNYCIEEAGNTLSLGEKQLFCLARALLNKKKILILDEATAQLDTETDEIILKVIKEEFHHTTVLAITHKIHTVMEFDRVMVLDKGSLVEFDTISNLVENTDSVFYSLLEESLSS